MSYRCSESHYFSQNFVLSGLISVESQHLSKSLILSGLISVQSDNFSKNLILPGLLSCLIPIECRHFSNKKKQQQLNSPWSNFCRFFDGSLDPELNDLTFSDIPGILYNASQKVTLVELLQGLVGKSSVITTTGD